MASSISKEQIEIFKLAMQRAEPYPLDELDKHMFYDDKDEERVKRVEATLAKQILLENGVEM